MLSVLALSSRLNIGSGKRFARHSVSQMITFSCCQDWYTCENVYARPHLDNRERRAGTEQRCLNPTRSTSVPQTPKAGVRGSVCQRNGRPSARLRDASFGESRRCVWLMVGTTTMAASTTNTYATRLAWSSAMEAGAGCAKGITSSCEKSTPKPNGLRRGRPTSNARLTRSALSGGASLGRSL